MIKNKIVIEEQVLNFIRRQPPEARRRIREALHEVENDTAYPQPLEDELEGFYKLKIDRIRIILQSESGGEGPVLKAVFAERRSVVYEIFKQILSLE